MRRFTADWLYAPTEPTERHTLRRSTSADEPAGHLPRPHEVRLTRHAIERYGARARCGLRPALAESELRRKLADARIEWLPPAWARMALGQVSRNRAYALVDDVCLPLCAERDGTGFVAPTCIVRGYTGDDWLQGIGGRGEWNALRLAVEVTS